jgi:hypothetical protein
MFGASSSGPNSRPARSRLEATRDGPVGVGPLSGSDAQPPDAAKTGRGRSTGAAAALLLQPVLVHRPEPR